MSDNKSSKRDSLRRRVLRWFIERGEKGGTDDEAQDCMELTHQVETVRRWELFKACLVRDSGKKRPTKTGHPAIVWVATGNDYDAVDWAFLDTIIRPVAALRIQVETLTAERDLARAEVAKLRVRLEKMS
jgi:hypothetical protein